jgi:hypothetical protein
MSRAWDPTTRGSFSVPTEVSGLPAHVLLVHAVVVLVPLAALALVVAALWPAFRRKLGIVVPLVALLGLVLVPVTTHAGEWLASRVPSTALLQAHTELGDGLLPWAFGVFVLATGVWLLGRYAAKRRDTANGAADGTADGTARRGGLVLAAQVVAAVLAVVVAAGALVQTYRIGESGARAAWSGHFSATSSGGDGH